MKRLILITLLGLGLAACQADAPAEDVVSTIVIPTTESAATETQAEPVPQPTLTASAPAPTANTTAAAASTDEAVTPTESSSEDDMSELFSTGRFTNLQFSFQPRGVPSGFFQEGIEEIYAGWDYYDMSEGDVMRRIWYRDGKEWLVREENWDMAKYGSSGTVQDIFIYDYEGAGIEPAEYELVLYINGVLHAAGTFVIQTDYTTTQLTASTETQVATVQNGSILLLTNQDGTERELLTSNEIVELQWFPDGQHLLFVNRVPPAGDGPPWSRHEVWIVDTHSGTFWQISEEAENLHRIGPIRNPEFVRSIPGSDFGDACGMDRGLTFIQLDETYQRVALHKIEDFANIPTIAVHNFFPADQGKWVSDHEYEVNLTAFCIGPEFSTREELDQLGLYRFDLNTLSVTKIGG